MEKLPDRPEFGRWVEMVARRTERSAAARTRRRAIAPGIFLVAEVLRRAGLAARGGRNFRAAAGMGAGTVSAIDGSPAMRKIIAGEARVIPAPADSSENH
jgi:hypothetical protein